MAPRRWQTGGQTQWYRNVVADSRAYVEVGTPTGTDSYDATALITTGTEYDELWARIVAAYPFFADHQATVDRRIPVVALERAGPARPTPEPSSL